MMDIEKIQEVLPQRFPFLMIDRVLELEAKKRVVAIKNVSINDGFFAGHFPGNPVMPGALIIEAMAQTSIILFYEDVPQAKKKGVTYYLASVKARFLHPVIPGDQLKITAEPLKAIATMAIVNAVASVGDKEVARAEIGFSAKPA